MQNNFDSEKGGIINGIWSQPIKVDLTIHISKCRSKQVCDLSGRAQFCKFNSNICYPMCSVEQLYHWHRTFALKYNQYITPLFCSTYFLKSRHLQLQFFIIFAGDLDSIPRRKYVWYLTRSGSSLKRLYQAVKYFLSFNRGFLNNSDGQQRIQQQWTGDINLLFKTKYVSWKRLFANHLRATETPFTLAYRKGDPNKFFCFEIPWRQIISDDHIIWFDSEQENMMNLTRQWR